MKIKHQFIILVAMIIAIPVLCATYFPLYNYFTSPNRLLIDGKKDITHIESEFFSETDKKNVRKLLSTLPPDVQTALFSSTFELLATNIPELANTKKLDYSSFWSFVKNDEYIYQFSTFNTEKNNIVIVNRAPRKNDNRKARWHMSVHLYILLFILVLICVFIIIFIAKTIFNSISQIEMQTQALAEGNLNINCKCPSYTKKNEITTITDSLEKMRLSLEDAQTRRNKFIMGISHDLRTPVAIIKGYTEAISDGLIKEEEMEDTLNIISIKTSQLETMINTLINFMKLDTNDWRANLKEESITDLISQFCRESVITGTVFKRNITSEIHFKNNVFVPLEPQLVRRCFENIFSNAIRYTKDNDSINLYATENEDAVIFKISDTGEGMSSEDLNHIFDLFYRGTNSRREEGMGIGLSVVKSIICTFNWDIQVESEPECGSTFTITIPKKPGLYKSIS